jgi:predicted DCC family thiol-disulfide oxidoreductase YuxK
MNASTRAIPAWQFTVFRIVFGLYLTIHFAALVPWAAELFGSAGVMSDPARNPSAGLFPNPLNLTLPPAALIGAVLVLSALSLGFAAGWMRPAISLVLWFGWTALFHRNNLIANPSIPYVGLLLALCVIVPAGEPWSFGKRRGDWQMPVWIPRCAWLLLAAGYTFSGHTKLHSPSWLDGSAMQYLLENPLARPGWMRDVMLLLPDGVLKGLTWFTLGAELLFLPLACLRKTRPWIWLILLLMHLGIIAVVDFADLSFGMLMIHAFTFDHRWVAGKFSRVVVAYDGDCLFCSAGVRFLAGEDERDALRFTTLQGGRGQEMEARAGTARLSTVVVEADGVVFSKIRAIRALLAALGGMWRVAAWGLSLVPERLGNIVYHFVAAHRYRWFGKNQSCGLPSPELRSKLL